MTDDSKSAVTRSASCQANLDQEYPTCDRCGLAWRAADVAPACRPMSIEALRLALLNEAAALEGSHHVLVSLAEGGAPADPVEPLKRAAALRGVLLFVTRCSDSRVIIDELKRIGRALAAADADPRKVKLTD